VSRRRASVSASIFAGLLGQAALVVSGVLAARMLGVEDRGNLALLVLFPAVLSQIGSLGLPLATTYELSKHPRARGELVRRLATPVAAQAVTLVLVHAAILAGIFWSDPHPVRLAALVTLGAVPAALAQLYGLAILQGQQRFVAFNILRTLPAVAYSAAILGLFLADAGTLERVTIAWIACSAVLGVATVLIALRASSLGDAREAIASIAAMLRFGLRGLLGSTSPIETFRLDQAVVGLFLSTASLGLYVAGLAFANLPRFIAQSIGYVAYPRVAGRASEQEARGELWQFFWLAVAVCSVVVVALEVSVGSLVPFFFTHKFDGAVSLTRILLVSALFLSARRVLTDGVVGLGRPGLGTLAEVSSWAFLVPALAVLTPLLGARGVALSLVVSSALSFGVLLWLLVSSRPGRVRQAFHAAVRGAGR
jgi:O-antigen/teichoic acid export membrane protein